jgi:hypothetical protein
MHWKVKLDGDENALAQLAQASSPTAQIMKDGIEWFLESNDFALMSDHQEVKQRAAAIVHAMGANVSLGPVYRMHYDNSKTVYRD